MKRALPWLLALLLTSLGLTQTTRLSISRLSSTGASAGNAVTYSGSAITWGSPIPAAPSAALITSGTVATAWLGSGTASSTTYLRGDNTWATPAGGGSVDQSAAYNWTGQHTFTLTPTVGGNNVLTTTSSLPAANLTGTVATANGGTGANITPLLGGVVYGNGSTLSITAAGTSPQYLKSNGSAPPSWATLPTASVDQAATYAWTGAHAWSGQASFNGPLSTGFLSVTQAGSTQTLATTAPRFVQLTGAAGGQVNLPAATSLTLGTTYRITNRASNSGTIANNAGTALVIIAAGEAAEIHLTANGTAAGTWDTTYDGVAVTSGKMLSVSNTLTLAGTDGSTLNVGTGGTLTQKAYKNATASTAASAAINTTATTVAQGYAIPANTLAVSDSFRITIYGTNTSTAAGTNTFAARFGTLGTTGDAALNALTTTSATTGTAVPFVVELHVVVRAIGASGTLYSYGKLENNGTTGVTTTTPVINTGATSTVNTTVVNILQASVVTSATTTTDTIQSVIIERL